MSSFGAGAVVALPNSAAACFNRFSTSDSAKKGTVVDFPALSVFSGGIVDFSVFSEGLIALIGGFVDFTGGFVDLIGGLVDVVGRTVDLVGGVVDLINSSADCANRFLTSDSAKKGIGVGFPSPSIFG